MLVLLNNNGKVLASTIVLFAPPVKTRLSNMMPMPGVVGAPVAPVSRLAATMQSRSVPLRVDEFTMKLAPVVEPSPGSSVLLLTTHVAACTSDTANTEAKLA